MRLGASVSPDLPSDEHGKLLCDVDLGPHTLVPCWLVGQRAKRQHLREQAPVE